MTNRFLVSILLILAILGCDEGQQIINPVVLDEYATSPCGARRLPVITTPILKARGDGYVSQWSDTKNWEEHCDIVDVIVKLEDAYKRSQDDVISDVELARTHHAGFKIWQNDETVLDTDYVVGMEDTNWRSEYLVFTESDNAWENNKVQDLFSQKGYSGNTISLYFTTRSGRDRFLEVSKGVKGGISPRSPEAYGSTRFHYTEELHVWLDSNNGFYTLGVYVFVLELSKVHGYTSASQAWEEENLQAYLNDYFQEYLEEQISLSGCGTRERGSWAKDLYVVFVNQEATNDFIQTLLDADLEGGISPKSHKTYGSTRFTYHNNGGVLRLNIDNIYVHDVDVPNHCQ